LFGFKFEEGLLLSGHGGRHVIPPGGCNVATMSVKPSVFEFKVATKVATFLSEVATPFGKSEGRIAKQKWNMEA
jgi:hypothetical protein